MGSRLEEGNPPTDGSSVVLPRRVPASENLSRGDTRAGDVLTRLRTACGPWAPSVVVSLALLALMGIGIVSAVVFLKATRGRLPGETLALRKFGESHDPNATVSTILMTVENITTVVLQGSEADYVPL